MSSEAGIMPVGAVDLFVCLWRKRSWEGFLLGPEFELPVGCRGGDRVRI